MNDKHTTLFYVRRCVCVLCVLCAVVCVVYRVLCVCCVFVCVVCGCLCCVRLCVLSQDQEQKGLICRSRHNNSLDLRIKTQQSSRSAGQHTETSLICGSRRENFLDWSYITTENSLHQIMCTDLLCSLVCISTHTHSIHTQHTHNIQHTQQHVHTHTSYIQHIFKIFDGFKHQPGRQKFFL